MSGIHTSDGFVTTLRANQSITAFVAVAINASSTTEFLCEIADTSTSHYIGIAQDDRSTDGAVAVSILGLARARCGASISAGSIITWATGTGQIVAGAFDTTTSYLPHPIGRALQAGSTDSVIKVFLSPMFQATT